MYLNSAPATIYYLGICSVQLLVLQHEPYTLLAPIHGFVAVTARVVGYLNFSEPDI